MYYLFQDGYCSVIIDPVRSKAHSPISGPAVSDVKKNVSVFNRLPVVPFDRGGLKHINRADIDMSLG